MRIGITERGDAGIDFSWVEKLDTVDAAILITKHVSDQFISAILPHKDKVILHATITGWGKTRMEPNVPGWKYSMSQLMKLVACGFPKEQIIIRVDPIIPTKDGVQLAGTVIQEFTQNGFDRFRISIIDMYPHVRKRFADAGISTPYGDNFAPTDECVGRVNEMCSILQSWYPNISIEACAEPKLTAVKHIGCVNADDMKLLGLSIDNVPSGYQRHDCLCLGCKTELLENKHRCPHQCLYCYWRD